MTDPTETPSAGRTFLSMEQAVLEALWDLVFAGLVTGDTLGPLRARLAGGHTAHRSRRPAPRARMRPPSRLALLGSRGGAATVGRAAPVPGEAAGRWSLLPGAEPDPTVRLHAAAEMLLDRYGIVTRGSVLAEDTPGGFAGVYRVLATMEESGRIRRGYFVEGLGAAQFASPGAVDRVRSLAPRPGDLEPIAEMSAVVLAAADPANPYGAALPWPALAQADSTSRGAVPNDTPPGDTAGKESTGHRPARRAGALVCLVGGQPVLYAERGGRTMLSFTDDPAMLDAAAACLADLVHSGRVAGLTVTRIDGQSVQGSEHPVADALRRGGFAATPRGLRLRAGTGQRTAAGPPAGRPPGWERYRPGASGGDGDAGG